MALLPGPAELFDLAQFDLQPETPEFEEFVLGQHAELDALDGELAPAIAGIDAAAANINQEVFATAEQLDAAALEVEDQLYRSPLEQDPAFTVGAAEIEVQLETAINSIPPEAYQDFPSIGINIPLDPSTGGEDVLI